MMNSFGKVARIAIALVVLALLLPLLVWIGLAAIGIAVVLAVVGAVAGYFVRKRGGFETVNMQYRTWQREPGNGTGDKSRSTIIIDHE